MTRICTIQFTRFPWTAGPPIDMDMAAAVQTLRDAGSQQNAAAARDKLVAVSQGQKNIEVLLRTLSDRLARQRSQAALQARLRALVLRQTASTRQVREAVTAQGQNPKFPAKQYATTLGSEEDAICQELAQALDAMQKTVADPTGARDAKGAARALKEATDWQLLNQAAAASTNTLGAKLR